MNDNEKIIGFLKIYKRPLSLTQLEKISGIYLPETKNFLETSQCIFKEERRGVCYYSCKYP